MNLDDFKPATDGLLESLAQGISDCRAHEHPTRGEDFYCLNLVAFAGERMGPVLRRLRDAEAEVERLLAELAALDNRWLEGCCEHRDPESVDLWRGTLCPTCARAVVEVESAVTIPREAAARAILGAFHDLHPRIPGLETGDCHCNLLAAVALTALVEAGFLAAELVRLRDDDPRHVIEVHSP